MFWNLVSWARTERSRRALGALSVELVLYGRKSWRSNTMKSTNQSTVSRQSGPMRGLWPWYIVGLARPLYSSISSCSRSLMIPKSLSRILARSPTFRGGGRSLMIFLAIDQRVFMFVGLSSHCRMVIGIGNPLSPVSTYWGCPYRGWSFNEEPSHNTWVGHSHTWVTRGDISVKL